MEKVRRKLGRSFYAKPTLDVAKGLLGKYIVRKAGKKELAGKIVEVEAYVGAKDRASHSFGGKRTPRNQAEYLTGGHIYIYLVYGMYWQLNISTFQKEEPECVLIRAIEPIIDGKPKRELIKLANGPGKLCRYLKLDKSFYAEDVTKSRKIWLEDRGEEIKPLQILATKRIGIDYAGPYWSNRKWRFLIKDYKSFLPKK